MGHIKANCHFSKEKNSDKDTDSNSNADVRADPSSLGKKTDSVSSVELHEGFHGPWMEVTRKNHQKNNRTKQVAPASARFQAIPLFQATPRAPPAAIRPGPVAKPAVTQRGNHQSTPHVDNRFNALSSDPDTGVKVVVQKDSGETSSLETIIPEERLEDNVEEIPRDHEVAADINEEVVVISNLVFVPDEKEKVEFGPILNGPVQNNTSSKRK